jgi:V/A-type H+-transporting ATPase subunit I
MFYPVGMQKIRIYALKTVSEQLVKELHALGMVEIVSSEHKGLESGSPEESFNRISAQLVRMRAIKNSLPKKGSVHPEFSNPLAEAEGITIEEDVKRLYEELSKIDSELKGLAEELAITKRLQVFKNIDFAKLNTRTISYIAGTAPRENIRKITKELEQSPMKHKVHWVADKKDAFLVIVFEKGPVDVERLLTPLGFKRLEVPSELTSPEKYSFWLERETKIKQKRIEEINSEISAFAEKYYGKISILEKQLSVLADEAQIASKFCSSKSVYVIEGWMKQADVSKLDSALKRYDGRVYVEKLKAGHHEVAPTVMNHEGAAKPYQFITKTYSLPSSNEVDPTILYFVTIPLIYGMIVGDVIYGLISLFLSLIFLNIFKKSEMMSSISMIWLYSAIPAILFGIAFDEYAGMSHTTFLQRLDAWGIGAKAIGVTAPLYTGLSRLHHLTTVFQITLYVGMIHLALGFLLGAINEWGHNKKHAIGKLAWIFVELGGYLAIASFLFNAYPADIGNIGAAILGVAILAVAVTEGVVGILEVPGIAGNVFSYLRIAVVGVVGTILAEIINLVFLPMPQQGLLALVFFPIFIILHIVNAFIAMFEAMIQGGRLNIIEFKMKFLKGGGRPFKPFAVNKIL